MRSLFRKRRLITWVLLMVLVLQTIFASFSKAPVTVYAEDANERLSNYIKLAKGKNITDIDVSQITSEELQLLGVYLSNFYVPMSTEIGVSRDDDVAKKNMVEALVNGASFNKDIAEVLVQGIWDMTIASAKPLKIGYSEKGSDTVNFVPSGKFTINRSGENIYVAGTRTGTTDKDGNVKATYASFMDFFTGLSDTDSASENRTVNSIISGANVDKFYLCWKNSKGDAVPVFDTACDGNFMRFTASSLTYAMINSQLNYGNGVGSSLMDCSPEDYKNLKSSAKKKVLCIDSQLYVDCFGNIIVDCGIAKYILVPACANPYAWYTKEDKSDIGKNINLVNLFMLQEAEEHRIEGAYLTEDYDILKKGWVYNFYIGSGEDSLITTRYWRIQRDGGNDKDNCDLDQSAKPGSYGLNDTFKDRVRDFFAEANGGDTDNLGEFFSGAGNAQRFYNWSSYEGMNVDPTIIQPCPSYPQVVDGYNTDVIDDFIFFDNLNMFKNAKDEDGYSIFNLLNDGSGGILQLTKSADGGTDADDDGDAVLTAEEDVDTSTDSDIVLSNIFQLIFGMGATYPDTAIAGLPLTNSGGLDFGSVSDENQINIVKSGRSKCYLAGMYVSYALAYYNDFSKDSKGKNSYIVNYAYNKDNFPSAGDVEIDWSNVKISSDAMDNEIKSMIYYFLHPTEGISYVAKWFKNKISGILVSWHEDMVGSSDGTSTTGSTKYLGFSGYVTLPALSDIKWTAWLLSEYNNIVVYLIIIIFVILIAYCIVGIMTFQRAIFGTLLFGVLAFFPPLCINATINTINNTCDRIYGSKFTYWALVQNQNYVDELNNAMESESKDSYLVALFKDQAKDLDPNNYARVKLKWLSPKKVDVKADVNEGLNKFTNSALLSNIMNGMLNQQLSGETYQDSEDALFLYRDYADLYCYATSSYKTDTWYNNSLLIDGLVVNSQDLQSDTDATVKMCYNSTDSNGNPNTMEQMINEKDSLNKEYSQKFAQTSGFTVNTGTDDMKNRRFTFLLDSGVGVAAMKRNAELLSGDISKDIVLKPDNFKNPSQDASHIFGFGTDDFNVTLPKINGGIEDGSDPNTGQTQKVWASDTGIKFEKDKLGKFYFGLYTESPFYFFTWNIYDQQNSDEFKSNIGNSSKGIDSMLMDMYTINNQQYFYNYNNNALNGYGEMRDFCDMRSLFYYVVPYLREVNKGVLKWSDLYGTFTYEDVKVRYENGVPSNYPTSKDSDEYIYKWWHNYNVERLFNTYSPWVDLMYSCDYAKSETITVLGKKYLVVDPLDPTSYFKVNSSGDVIDGRMMVFSRSEMEYYGLTMNDLTKVEQKIIKVQDQVYQDLLQLMDYADFDNDVLVTSAGMLTTFAFNQEFSQTTPIGRSYTLYPQSYELKAFSYDAYLRLILAESTGEDLMNTENANFSENQGQKSYYQRIVENSSITTGIGLIILDVIAVYAIPALKLFFLIAIFFMSILMIVASAIKLELNIVQKTWDALIAPLLSFSAVSIGLAWIVSLFMSDGNTAVTNRGGLTISLGDPVMVTLVMIVLNVVVLILYYKICKKCFKKVVEFAKAVATSMGGAIGGTLGKLAGLAIGGKVMSDSVAKGTAKARGKSNKPSASSTGIGSGSGGSAKAGAFVAGATAGATAGALASGAEGADTESEAKKKHYDNLSKAQSSEVADMDKKAQARRDRYERLSGGTNQSKADAIEVERRARKAERDSNVSAIKEKKARGEKLTLRERTYSARASLADARLAVGQGVTEAKGKVKGKFNEITGRTRRAKAKADIAERSARAREDFYRTLNTEKQVANQKATKTGTSARERKREPVIVKQVANRNNKDGKYSPDRKKDRGERRRNNREKNKSKNKNKNRR